MAGEDNAVRIIGSDSERRENCEMGGDEDRSESEEKVKSGEGEQGGQGEGIKSVEEGEEMDGGGWAWVVVLGEPICGQVLQHNFPKSGLGNLKCWYFSPIRTSIFLSFSFLPLQYGDRWPWILLWGAS